MKVFLAATMKKAVGAELRQAIEANRNFSAAHFFAPRRIALAGIGSPR